VNSSQDLLKTQNVKRGNKVSENLADSNAQLETARNFSGSGGREQQPIIHDKDTSSLQKKHSTDTVDILNKKYSLGIESLKGPNSTTQKNNPQNFGYDSGLTLTERNTQ